MQLNINDCKQVLFNNQEVDKIVFNGKVAWTKVSIEPLNIDVSCYISQDKTTNAYVETLTITNHTNTDITINSVSGLMLIRNVSGVIANKERKQWQADTRFQLPQESYLVTINYTCENVSYSKDITAFVGL